MKDSSLYQIYFDSEVEDKKQVYELIENIVCKSDTAGNKEMILEQLENREKVGSSLIHEHIILPHLESNYLSGTQILFIKPQKSIAWNDSIKDINLIIVILLKADEELATKKEISMFTRSLASEDFLDELLNSDRKNDFEETLLKFQEEHI
ncbi:PTS sugar transporter subunit IIA [Salinicoccus carnicancri]|uniref:PTS sugar transporter subunit IIA n=1 Tax=Salinicoccus carnicancri TaxID=558170 RepID=UPI0003644429|nr:PTS sugar transporter subunit IIA [Salinicoccus carnicancri]